MAILPSDPRGRVLFADDDDGARESIATMLRRLGYTCECVPSAVEALECLRAGEFEVLLADIHMPGNTALELVGAATSLVPGLPVVLLTGQPSVETASRSVRLPVAAYLTKPPDLAELTQVLDQAVSGYRDYRLVREGRERLRAWEAELAQIEHALRLAPESQAGDSVEHYVRVSLRQAILVLSDLERATQVLDRRTADRLAQLDHVAALRHTVAVLERTRQNFKSKDLADLRRQIEHLLARDRPSTRDGASAGA